MVGSNSGSQILAILMIIAFTLFTSSQAAGVGIYWGQNTEEGSLADACTTGNYQIINIAFLSTFGDGQDPVLNLADHCDAKEGACSSLSSDIRKCQDRNIIVLLSLGGKSDTYFISDDDDAKKVADYLWNNFLGGGSSDSRPLGDAVLDGIDFHIEAEDSGENWEPLAKALRDHSSDTERKMYLSAAPGCRIPDRHLGTAIDNGHFDYLWVQFYNNEQCDHRAGVKRVFARWKEWTKAAPNSKIFLGLLADSEAEGSGGGYMSPDVLTEQVLPKIATSDKFGGVMLWNRYYDRSYSDSIKGSVQSYN